MIYFLLIFLIFVVYKIFDFSVLLEGPVKSIFLFILFAVIYYLAIPIEMIIKGTTVGAYGIIIDDRTKMIIIAMAILGIIGFSTGYFMSGFKFNDIIPDLDLKDLLSVSVLSIVFLTGISLFGLYGDSIVKSIHSYDGNVSETFVNPVYAYLKETFYFYLSVLIALFGTKKGVRNILAITGTLILAFLGVLSSDKDPLLLAGLGWAVVYFYKIQNKYFVKVRHYFTVLIVAVIIIPILSHVFSMYRAGSLENTYNVIKSNGIFTYFDASGPFESLVEIINNPNPELQGGKTYLIGFVSWIPRSVWPDRPMDLATIYAQQKMQNWQPGTGMGYSLMTEAYKNFGIPGALIQYFLIGLLSGLLGILLQKLFKNNSASQMLFFIWLAYNLAIMHRVPFNLPSSFIRFLLPILFTYWGLVILSKSRQFLWKAKKI